MRTVSLTTLVLMMWTSSLLKAQTTKDLLTKFTSDYIEYYNNCKVDKILELCTDDIEVYHDLAGLINGKVELGVQSKKFCDWTATPDAPTVKSEIVGDIQICELKTQGDKLYGAVINGTLVFYAINKQTGTKKKHSTADFTWILRLTVDKWQIARDISYNHQETSAKD